jgi:NitT/TauT family transport system ATP-binding protein
MSETTQVAHTREERTVPADTNYAIQLEHVTQVYQSSNGPFTAVKDVSLVCRQGEFVSLVGPSGCGKSTLLWLLSGLTTAHSGSVKVFGREVDGVHRNVGLIVQRDALLPWKTALENVALPLRFRGASRRDAQAQSRQWLRRVGLQAFEDSYPHQLSGGMRKRVAIAATLSYEPKVLCMDEPFSSLDVQTRNLMENDLLELWSGSGQTVLFITHDLEEAVGLSDRVIVMTASPGTVLGEHEVALPRPRDLLEDKLQPDFAATYSNIWDHLRGEVLRAYRDATATNTDNQPKDK